LVQLLFRFFHYPDLELFPMFGHQKLQAKEIDGLIRDLQIFIDLSFQGDDRSMREWISETINRIDSQCWQNLNCSEKNCPAYRNECGRCWLIAGTMCGGEVQGKFAEKYGTCTSCEVYLNVIGNDPIRKLREQMIALIHSLRLREHELREAQSELKILSGLLPICMECKKIRDGQGTWNQLEAYIDSNSEATFSHGICPECLKRVHPDIVPNED